ncbi:uncharacterized protein PHACADRAFT_148656 [Phanerochaete carnosa HHB-10118-sp]|uniref:Uncharacterized protein n=1 Tax=Phanerochaete carnosa (strain HHB-10118-sp) TaxID=650164 RepID=K5W405_PHACS|nr:uncharacterized protein PHACADRAFT_148656 [Phanerochaete carnosa HHB-10118-sp]EKM53840.1 hypothetical protein PHACADRAFT_148656 [Phanerochaete carnosa HHB-10118-sp]
MQAIIVDNTNPEIDYLTGWYNETTHTSDYNQTTAYSGNPNSEFQFTFNGTSIAIYGCILPNNTAVSTYSLDTAASVTYTNKNSTEYMAKQLFYQSSNVPDGEHTLVVNAPDAVIGLPWTTYCFDYLTYVPSASDASTGQPSSSSGPPAASPGKASNLKVILPAVLVPSLVIIVLLFVALYAQRTRLSRLRVRAKQASTPYTQTSLLHRVSAPVTLDTKVTEDPSIFSPDILSPRPDSSYTSDFQVYQPTIAELGSAASMDQDRLPNARPLLPSTGGRSMVEVMRSLVSQQDLSTRQQAVPQSAAENIISDLDAPPTYTSGPN